MDLGKLELLSTAALQALRDKTQELLNKRNANALRIGAIAWFLDREGTKRWIRIERVNAKSVSGRAIDPETQLVIGATWRVSPALLNIVDVSAKAKEPPKPATVHKPTTSASAW